MAIIDELVTLLSFEDDPNNDRVVNKFDQGLKKVADQAFRVVTAMAAVGTAVAAVATKTLQGIDASDKFAESVGFSYEQLQEWEFAAERAGGTTDSLRAGIEGLTQTISALRPGEFNEELAVLGIAANDARGNIRPLNDILLDLAGRFEGLSKVQAQQFGRRLGLNQETILLLQQGRGEIRALRNEARQLGVILPEDSAAIATEFRDSYVNLTRVIRSLVQIVAVALAPALQDVTMEITQWVVANRELVETGIQSFIEGLIQGVRDFLDILHPIIRTVLRLTSAFFELGGETDNIAKIARFVTGILLFLSGTVILGFVSNAIRLIAGLGKLRAVFALIAAAGGSTVAVFTAIAAAIFLIGDEIVRTILGGDTLINRHLPRFGQFLRTVFENAIVVVKNFKEQFARGLDFDFTKLFDGVDFDAIFSTFKNSFLESARVFLSVGKAIGGFILDGIIAVMQGLGNLLGNAVEGALASVIGEDRAKAVVAGLGAAGEFAADTAEAGGRIAASAAQNVGRFASNVAQGASAGVRGLLGGDDEDDNRSPPPLSGVGPLRPSERGGAFNNLLNLQTGDQSNNAFVPASVPASQNIMTTTNVTNRVDISVTAQPGQNPSEIARSVKREFDKGPGNLSNAQQVNTPGTLAPLIS